MVDRRTFFVSGLSMDEALYEPIFRAMTDPMDQNALPKDSLLVLGGNCLAAMGDWAKSLKKLHEQYVARGIGQGEFLSKGDFPHETREFIRAMLDIAAVTTDTRVLLAWMAMTSKDYREFLRDDLLKAVNKVNGGLYAEVEKASLRGIETVIIRGESEAVTVADLIPPEGIELLQMPADSAIEFIRRGISSRKLVKTEKRVYDDLFGAMHAVRGLKPVADIARIGNAVMIGIDIARKQGEAWFDGYIGAFCSGGFRSVLSYCAPDLTSFTDDYMRLFGRDSVAMKQVIRSVLQHARGRAKLYYGGNCDLKHCDLKHDFSAGKKKQSNYYVEGSDYYVDTTWIAPGVIVELSR